MKYSQEHLDNMEDYAKKLNLPAALVHIARTEYQADVLNEVISDCLSWNDFYATNIEHDFNDPTREYDEAVKAKKTLEEYLMRTDFSQMLLLNQIIIPDNDSRDKPKKTLNTFKELMKNKLIEADFSKTAINNDIIPILLGYLKNYKLI